MLEHHINGLELINKFGINNINVLPVNIREKLYFSHKYQVFSDEERDRLILSIIKSLQNNKFRVSGENDNSVWEKGWGEILSLVQKDQFSRDSLIPQYFNREYIFRLFKQYIYSDSKNFAYDIDQAIRIVVFYKYLIKFKHIVEIGSGTGNSQLLLAAICPTDTTLVASDWSTKSLELIRQVSKNLNRSIQPVLFNMLSLDGYDNLQINQNTAVFTVHALEQLGKAYLPFLHRLIASKPAICVNLEPVKELYEPDTLMDYLAIKYHEIRNYLDGWLNDLKILQNKGIIEIIEIKKIPFGNKYHEAYNLIVWKPVG